MRKGGGELLLLSSPEVTDDLSKACFGESDGGSRSQTDVDGKGGEEAEICTEAGQ